MFALQTAPLPKGWSNPEAVADVILADGVRLRRSGLSSIAPTGEEIVGSAAETSTSPVDRSWYELLERASILEATRSLKPGLPVRAIDGTWTGSCDATDVFPLSSDPLKWKYARSNGVALHRGWGAACQRARWELVERDRILRAWYGDTVPEIIELDGSASPFASTLSYTWRAYAFPDLPNANWSAGVHAVGIFGFPQQPGAPFVAGYGARDTLVEARDAATREAMQSLAFLWGESIPVDAPPPSPTPMHHLELLLWPGRHALLRAWLEKGHARYRGAMTFPRPSRSVRFVDLTPEWLDGDLRVAKATCDAAAPLVFGEGPFGAHLPPELRIHPIA